MSCQGSFRRFFVSRTFRCSGLDETVLNAMVDGWRAQMLARGLAVDTIKGRCAVAAANACLHALSSNMSATFLPSLSVRAAVTSLATCSQIPSGA